MTNGPQSAFGVAGPRACPAGSDDVPLLLEMAADGAPDLREAARQAFLRATDPAVDPALVHLATTPGSARAALAIEVLADRAAAAAIDPLVDRSSEMATPTLAPAALKALGSLIRPDDLPWLLANYAAASDGPLADACSKCVWDVVRRHPDPAGAADVLEKPPPERRCG